MTITPDKYQHLIGLPFDEATANCYQLVRAFYRDVYGIELTDYACPHLWWQEGKNLIMDFSSDEGFSLVNSHPRDWRPGDVIVMAVQATVGNHVAVLLPNSQILHHLWGQLSCVTSYGGTFRNNTLGVYRHRDVPETEQTITDFKEVLPLHVQRRLAAAVPDAGS